MGRRFYTKDNPPAYLTKAWYWWKVRELSSELAIPHGMSWTTPRDRMKAKLAQLKAQKAWEDRKGGRVYLMDITYWRYVENGDMVQETQQILTKTPETPPTPDNLTSHYRDGYRSNIVPNSIEIKRTKRIINYKPGDYINQPMYGEALTRPHLQPLENIQTGKCAYDVLQQDHGLTMEQIRKVVPHNPIHGMTPRDFQDIITHYNINAVVVDLLDRELVNNMPTNEKRNRNHIDRLASAYVCADGHIYRVSEEQRQIIIGRRNGMTERPCVELQTLRAEKKTDPPQIIHVNSWTEAKTYQPAIVMRRYSTNQAKEQLELALEMAAELTYRQAKVARRDAKRIYKEQIANIKRAYDQARAQRDNPIRVIVNQPCLFQDIVAELKNNVAYNTDMCLRKKECHVVRLSRSVVIYANPNHEEYSALAKQLGLTYTNQTMAALATQFFRSINRNRWVQSTVTEPIRRLLGGVCSWNRSWAVEVKGDEVVHCVDLYRCFTSCAMLVDPLIIDLLTEPKLYDGEPIDSTSLYAINMFEDDEDDTDDTDDVGNPFTSSGIYIAELVEMGLDDGLITEDNIEYVIQCRRAPQNKQVLHEFINRVRKLPNDKHTKELVNFLIGSAARSLLARGTPGNKTIVSTEVEAQYLRTVAEHDDTQIDCISAKEYGLCSDLFQVSSKPRQTSNVTDAVLRLQIVDMGRLELYRLYKQTHAYVAQHGGQVCQVKTDAVIYKLPYGVAPMPTDDNKQLGSTRCEEVKQQANFTYQVHGGMSCARRYDVCDTWSTYMASKTEDFDFRMILKHDRCLITGDAGVGKSYILRELVAHFRGQDKRVETLAFSNTAAQVIGGRTFHSVWCMNLQGMITKPAAFAKWVANTDVVIVDEISMVTMQIYKMLVALPSTIKMYCFGDFKQLRPIEGDMKTRYLNTHMLKGMLDGNRIVLRKNYRADDSFAQDARQYRTACKLNDDTPLPTFVNHIESPQPCQLPLTNICYTNAKRRELNQAIVTQEAAKLGVARRTDRLRVYNSPAGQELHCLEYINGNKLAAVVANPQAYGHLFGDCDDREQQQKVHMLAKLLANSEPHVGPIRMVRSSFARANQLFTGRQYALGSVSMQNIPRRIREVAADGHYTDIDICNAHPTIYNNFCQSYELPCTYVAQYVDDREGVLNKLGDELNIDRKVAKTLILELLNGSSLRYQLRRFKLTGHPYLTGLTKEVEANARDICDMESVRYGHFITHLTENNLEPERRPMHRFVNQYLCQMERQILDTVVGCLRARKYLGKEGDSYVPCFDGVMVPSSPKLTAAIKGDLLNALSNEVYKKWGVKVQLVVKPMETHEVQPIPYSTVHNTIKHLVEDHRLDEFPHIFPTMRVISNWTERATDPVTKAKTTLYVKNQHDTITHVGDGDVTMESGLVIPVSDLQRKWRPAYAITCHKSQGMTINEPYFIHQFDMLPLEGKYVALTRTTNREYVSLVV